MGSSGRSPAVIVIRHQQISLRAQGFQAIHAILGAFNLDIEGLGAGLNGGFEDAHLLLHAAVEFPAVLMPSTSREDGAIGVA